MMAKRALGILRAFALALVLVASAWVGAPARTAGAAATILYVKSNASGANNGSSWTNAYTSLQTALDAAALGGYEIWVAAGTYRPFRNLLPSASDTFQLHNGVALYGGFAGTETQRDERNWKTNVTILDGHEYIPFKDYNANNVVTGSGTGSSAILDGFTVTGGKARGQGSRGDPWDYYGGGMQIINGSPAVSNTIFIGNSACAGAGGMNIADTSSPTLTNITFIRNSAGVGCAGGDGGAMEIYYNSNPSLVNVTFNGNSASAKGGAMWSYSVPQYAATPHLTNVAFSGNSAANGGAMYNESAISPYVTNATFSGNSATGLGGAMYNDSSGVIIINSVLWGNVAPAGAQVNSSNSSTGVAYSDIQGGYAGTGNINSDPRFIRNPSPGADGTWGTADDDYGDLHLRAGSPAIDVGNSAAVPVGITTDRDGNPRIMGKAVDMGAFETFLKLFLPLIMR